MQTKLKQLVEDKNYLEGALHSRDHDPDWQNGKWQDEVRDGLRLRIEKIDRELDEISQEIHEGFERAIDELTERRLNICFFGKNKEKRLDAIKKRIEALRQYTREFIREIPLGAWNTLERLNS